MVSPKYEKYLENIEAAFSKDFAMKPVLIMDLGELLEAVAIGLRVDIQPGPVNAVVPDISLFRGATAIGHFVACEPGLSMGIAVSKGETLRYVRAIASLILTNFVEFRWYMNGEVRRTANLGFFDVKKTLYREDDGVRKVDDLFKDFLGMRH